ncbi:MAG: hypothetical protein RJB68_2054, partial [Pseudomonadota bacterium]
MKNLTPRHVALTVALMGACLPAVQAQDKVLNVYSARHYP